ncbi:MAG: hypothetical protein GQ578_02645 [Desulfuromonadaceae bacterium]|nr:hypothetical protein [Desulfuromonadaceae bacterium]
MKKGFIRNGVIAIVLGAALAAAAQAADPAFGKTMEVPVESSGEIGMEVWEKGFGKPMRNPFSRPVVRRDVRVENPNKATNKDIVFDGSQCDFPMNMASLRGRSLPRIKVTGVMMVDEKVAAVANVGDVGTIILRANERVLLANSAMGQKEASWFLVKAIKQDGMTIQLDDGTLVHGRF